MRTIQRLACLPLLSSAALLAAGASQAVTIVPGDILINKSGGVVVHLDGTTGVQTTLYTNSFASGSPIAIMDNGGFVVADPPHLLHVETLTQVENLVDFGLFGVDIHAFAIDRSAGALGVGPKHFVDGPL